MRFRRVIATAAAASLAATGLVACGEKEGKSQTIKAVSYTHLTLPTTPYV